MADRYLLDSDVLIWVLRNRRDTVEMLERLSNECPEPLACSSLSVLEIWAGVKPGETEKTAQLFEGIDVIPVDSVVARRAASLLAGRKRRDPREWIDALIAATALKYGMTLVTYNRKDYPYRGIALYPTSL